MNDADVVRTEAREKELDALIARRADQRLKEEGDDRRIAAAWAESCDRHRKERERDLAEQWLRYHEEQLERHRHLGALISAHHRSEIAKYAGLVAKGV